MGILAKAVGSFSPTFSSPERIVPWICSTKRSVRFLDDGATYLGNQLESELEKGRCFGIAANADFLLVCTYEENGENPELVVYKKR